MSYVEVKCRIVHETDGRGTSDGAILIATTRMFAGTTVKREVWVPKSVVRRIDRTYRAQGYDTLSIAEWFARKEELE